MPRTRSLDAKSYRLGVISLVVAIVALLVGVYTVKDQLIYAVNENSINVKTCPNLLTGARTELLAESSVAAPPKAGIRFEPSVTEPGRVDAYLAWINPADLQDVAVGMSGVYGTKSSGDGWIDHSQPAGSSGECWNWYAYAARDDAQPETVALVVGGLWPKQKYCFYDMYKIVGGGWSKPSGITCKVANWQESWGTPLSPK